MGEAKASHYMFKPLAIYLLRSPGGVLGEAKASHYMFKPLEICLPNLWIRK